MSNIVARRYSNFPFWRTGVLAFAALAIAWPATQQISQTSLPGSEWKVVEIDGRSSIGAGTLRFTKTSVRGQAACNRFFGAFRNDGKSIEIAGVNSTRMICQGRMQLENEYFSALARAASYRIEQQTLVLISKDGKPVAKLSG